MITTQIFRPTNQLPTKETRWLRVRPMLGPALKRPRPKRPGVIFLSDELVNESVDVRITWWPKHVNHEKNPPTFHCTGWFIGILIMVPYNPSIIGWYNPLYTLTNPGFFHCSCEVSSWWWLSLGLPGPQCKGVSLLFFQRFHGETKNSHLSRDPFLTEPCVFGSCWFVNSCKPWNLMNPLVAEYDDAKVWKPKIGA